MAWGMQGQTSMDYRTPCVVDHPHMNVAYRYQCAICGKTISPVQCSGPFSDAYDCPIHSPDCTNMGNISADLEAIDTAYRQYTDAIEGPSMVDYASDYEAYQTLKRATLHLKVAANNLLQRLRTGTRPGKGDDI